VSVTVKIPTPLRSLTRGKDSVQVSGATVREVLESLERECPGLRSRVCDEQGEMRRFVNLFLNEEDVRHLQALDTPVKEGDILSIVPAIAGGTNVGVQISFCARNR
jgi:sulfur-carrier protein